SFPPLISTICIPILWTGLEYFRSELYYLRFAWLTPGFAFAFVPGGPRFATAGVYGIGFLFAAASAMILFISEPTPRGKRPASIVATVCLLALAAVSYIPSRSEARASEAPAGVRVAAVQMEFPPVNQALAQLDSLHEQFPDAKLLVLSEYTF